MAGFDYDVLIPVVEEFVGRLAEKMGSREDDDRAQC